MSADFESELAALYGREPDLPDAAHFALDISARILREERRALTLTAVGIGVAAALVAPLAVQGVRLLSGVAADAVRQTDRLPPLSSPAMIAAAMIVALAAVIFGQVQARRL